MTILTIKDQIIIPKYNNSQMRAFIDDIIARTHGAEVTYITTHFENDTRTRINYTLTTTTREMAEEVNNEFRDGEYIYNNV